MLDQIRSRNATVSRTDLDELRSEAFPVVVVTILLGVWVATMAAFPHSPEITLIWPIALAAVGLASHNLLQRDVRLASLVFVGGISLAAITAILLYPNGLFAFFLAPVVLVAALLLGPRAGLVVAFLASGAVVLAHAHADWGQTSNVETMAIILLWTITLLAWLATRCVYTALTWSWHSYAQAIERVQELQQRQGELNRALKSLNDAYYQIEQTNVELERARAAAQEARRVKAEFAATISHELRTPLNLIIGFSEMMATAPQTYDGKALSPEYQCDVDAIYRNARHLSSLIDDILDLSQIDAERMVLIRESVALRDVVDQAIAATRGLLQRKGLALDADIPEELPCISVDPTRIRQVLINLLSNAARFTEHGGITIRAWLADHQIVVTVADTGPGIAPDDLGKVFEEFRQVDGSIRRRYGGSGLGLAICKKFVELHGGSIWVESTVSNGTTFAFSLPLTANILSMPVRREWQTWARQPSDGQVSDRVLVMVDHDPSVENLLKRHLDTWRIVATPDTNNLARVVHQVSARAVVLTNGHHASLDVEQLVSWPDLPVIVCPIHGRGELESELDVFDYLVKPIVHAQVKEILRRLRPLHQILIVDDDPEMVRLLGRMVRATNHRARVYGAYGGTEAIAAMEQAPPDLVLLDLLMPDLDGYAVIARMRQTDHLRNVPVVVVTAGGDRVEAIHGSFLKVCRPSGLAAVEVVRCLGACLNALSAEPASTFPPRQAAIAGSPASPGSR